MTPTSDINHMQRTAGPLAGEIRKPVPRRFAANVVVPDVWRDQLDIIYEFLYRQPDYEQLCLEVAHVLKTKLQENEKEYSSITYRAKDLNSFLEKLGRKSYKNPFEEITDFAGVRVVCIYRSDLRAIEKIIGRDFKLIEKVDKGKDKKTDRFGYKAVHFLVKLGEDFSGARYDHLKDLVCEVQVRTILQHAWATIDEHLVYKKKSSIPEEMSSRINHISLVLEEADKEFDVIRKERAQYIKALQKTSPDGDFLSREINLDSFRLFVERSFPDAGDDNQRDYDRVLKWIDSSRYRTIGDLQKLMRKASEKRDSVIRLLEEMLIQKGMSMVPWTNLELFHISMAICDREYRLKSCISAGFGEILDKMECTCE